MLKKWLSTFGSPPLDWIQIEVTSRCNAFCSYCPRTVFQKSWQNRDLPQEVFARLSPAFAKSKLVFLQGWGEPFLNPNLISMIRKAKAAGCQVGTTTNGILLNKRRIYQLVESGLDLLAISLAGIDEKNDALRRGTSIASILTAIRTLHKAKQELGKKLPAVHIAYILLHSSLEDIEKLPLFLQDLPVKQIVVNTLDFIPNLELEREAIIPANSKEYEDLRARLEAARVASEQFGTEFHYRLYKPGKYSTTCTENIQRSLFISSDGTLSPCVFTNLPISKESQQHLYSSLGHQSLHFGNVADSALKDIWRTKAYRNFRSSFQKEVPPSVCRNCPKLFVCM